MCYNVYSMDGRTVSFIREQAAGSACSLRVLETIGILGGAELAKKQKVMLGSASIGPDRKIGIQPFSEPIPLGEGELVIVDCENEEDVCIGYLNREKTKVIPLWQIAEHDSDLTDTKSTLNQCSQALFLPASYDGLELDFTLVVTKVDESSPRVPEENLKPEPVTNAAVLDELNKCLQRQPNNLADLIQLDQLIKVYQHDPLLKLSHIEGRTNESEDALVRRILRINQLMDRLPSRILEEGLLNTANVESGSNVVAHATLLPLGRLALSVLCTDLGKSGRSAPMEDLQLINEQLVLVGGAESSNVTNSLSYEVAAAALEVPEIYVDKEFKDKVQLLVSEHKTVYSLSLEVEKMIKALRQETGLSPHTVIDLGIIDVGHIKYPGNTSSNETSVSLFSNMAHVKARVYACKWMDVFSQASKLYECSVDGAKSAFFNAGEVLSCDATNCNSAFISAQPTDCYASNTRNAFVCAEATRCLAEDCEYAFSNKNSAATTFTVTNSIAINSKRAFREATATGCYARSCKSAFEGAKAEANTAENCRYAFYQTYGGYNNTVLNIPQKWRPHAVPLTYGLLRGNRIKSTKR